MTHFAAMERRAIARWLRSPAAQLTAINAIIYDPTIETEDARVQAVCNALASALEARDAEDAKIGKGADPAICVDNAAGRPCTRYVQGAKAEYVAMHRAVVEACEKIILTTGDVPVNKLNAICARLREWARLAYADRLAP